MCAQGIVSSIVKRRATSFACKSLNSDSHRCQKDPCIRRSLSKSICSMAEVASSGPIHPKRPSWNLKSGATPILLITSILMPKVPSISPATGNPITSPSFIHTLDCNFVDHAGRTLLLRGVNLSGSSKAPVDQPSYILEDFWEDAENGGKSFIERPLNVDDGSADVHLARLRGWGFNMLRFPVTWEALEHGAP